MGTKWACGECGCRWDSDWEARRCAKKDRRKEEEIIKGFKDALNKKKDKEVT